MKKPGKLRREPTAEGLIPPTAEVFAAISTVTLQVMKGYLDRQIQDSKSFLDPVKDRFQQEERDLKELSVQSQVLKASYDSGTPVQGLPNNTSLYEALVEVETNIARAEDRHDTTSRTVNAIEQDLYYLQDQSNQISSALANSKINPALSKDQQAQVNSSEFKHITEDVVSMAKLELGRHQTDVLLSDEGHYKDLHAAALDENFAASIYDNTQQFASELAYHANKGDVQAVNQFCSDEKTKCQQANAYLNTFLKNNSRQLSDQQYQSIYKDIVRLEVKAEMITSANATASMIIIKSKLSENKSPTREQPREQSSAQQEKPEARHLHPRVASLMARKSARSQSISAPNSPVSERKGLFNRKSGSMIEEKKSTKSAEASPKSKRVTSLIESLKKKIPTSESKQQAEPTLGNEPKPPRSPKM